MAEMMKVRAERAKARAEQERRQASRNRSASPASCTTYSGHQLSLINVQAGVGLHLMDNHRSRRERRSPRSRQRAPRPYARSARCWAVLRPEEEARPGSPRWGWTASAS
jgi:hypothetical protein